MSQSIFQVICSALSGAGKKVSFEIQGQSNGTIKAVVTAKLGPVAPKATIEEKKLHAAVSVPLVVSGTAEEVEQALLFRIATHIEMVEAGTSALDEIRALAANALSAASNKPGVKVTGAGKSVVAPATSNTRPDEGDGDGGDDDLDGGEAAVEVLQAPAAAATQYNF